MWTQVEAALNQSTTQLLSQLASLLPGIAALIVAVLVSALVGWILSWILRRVLSSVRFNEQVNRWGFESLREWSPSENPTLLIGRIMFWSVMLVGVLIGIAALDASLTSQLVFQLFTYLPHAVAAVVVLLVGIVAARFISRSVLIGAVNLNLQYARLLSSGVKWMIMVLTVTIALDHLAIGGDVVHLAFGILFGGIVLALSLAVGLGSKELVSRSLEREAGRKPVDVEEPFRHL